MKKGQILEGKVLRIDFPNKGIVEVEDEKVVVKNTIPGQKVQFAINKVRKGKKEGRLLEVLEKSPLEKRNKACKSFGFCGGCSYQTIPYEMQLDLKSNQVKKLIDQVVKTDYEFEGIIGSPKEWAYRNKMEFSFGDEYKDGPLALGLHKRGSFYDILTVDDCCIVDKDYNAILRCVLDYCVEIGADYFHNTSHEGYLRHLLVRKAVKTGEILVNIVTTSQEAWIREDGLAAESNALEANTLEGNIFESNDIYSSQINDYCENDIFYPMIERLLKLQLSGQIVGIQHTYNDSVADVIKCDRLVQLYGRDHIYEELLGLRFKISTFSFFQTNSLGAEVLYSKAREYIGETKDKVIFDLYSGTGTIAQLMAAVAKKITGVEIVEEAVEAAKENAGLNGLTNCEFIAGDVLKVIDDLKDDKPDLIVLDPPRDGIHPKALDKIIDFGVDRIIYISCKPTSLARDLEILQEKGYVVEKVCAVDMFPQTVHVETIIMMTKCGSEGKK